MERSTANVNFKFRVDPRAEPGVVAMTELNPGTLLVMARDELSDAQIVMAIARWCGKNEPAP